MERKNHLISFVFFVVFCIHTAGNDKLLIYNAYLNNDMQVWKTVIDRIQNQKKKSDGIMLQLVNYQYGYIAWCIGNNKNAEAKSYIILAEKNLAILERNEYNLSMVQAYRSAIYGYKIGLNTFHAPFIGPKSIKCAELALKYDPDNYFAHLQLGNIEYYKPSILGGSIENAIKHYQKAIALFKHDCGSVLQDWNYLQLLTIAAQAYYTIGDHQSARVYYEIILKIEPDFQWIKNELYPQVTKQLKQ